MSHKTIIELSQDLNDAWREFVVAVGRVTGLERLVKKINKVIVKQEDSE